MVIIILSVGNEVFKLTHSPEPPGTQVELKVLAHRTMQVSQAGTRNHPDPCSLSLTTWYSSALQGLSYPPCPFVWS